MLACVEGGLDLIYGPSPNHKLFKKDRVRARRLAARREALRTAEELYKIYRGENTKYLALAGEYDKAAALAAIKRSEAEKAELAASRMEVAAEGGAPDGQAKSAARLARALANLVKAEADEAYQTSREKKATADRAGEIVADAKIATMQACSEKFVVALQKKHSQIQQVTYYLFRGPTNPNTLLDLSMPPIMPPGGPPYEAPTPLFGSHRCGPLPPEVAVIIYTTAQPCLIVSPDIKSTDDLPWYKKIFRFRSGEAAAATTTTTPLAEDEQSKKPKSRRGGFFGKWRLRTSLKLRARLTSKSGDDDHRNGDPDPMDMLTCDGEPPPPLEEIRAWGKSFDKLMKSTAGRRVFRDFLRCEYSEENILFWLACEELKKESNPDLIEEKARFIYEDYISILSPKEVSLDSRVRELVNRNMVDPTPRTFDEAQLQIYTLMHRDSYPRFVNSSLFRQIAQLDSSNGNGSQSGSQAGTPSVGGGGAGGGSLRRQSNA
ncbi:uncharacterized protein LOC113209548 isoform X1 [Frankliniella occidentalis]|uniref:Uncharacterized protein LOC113209548 isoform X1 n=1 Tax=Frankliniella occidentalis TaxID=133901 RepID=A0A9C6WYB5_FRAOC|nr:uncharacterized protein LOC113209548 isoform X1 [Frankliniella occidentalis]